MKVILHADDFGYDYDTTQATIELLEAGVLSSASIMANMPFADVACNYASKHPEKSFGVHLTFVDELIPCCDPDNIPSLVNEDGRFLMASNILKKSLTLQLAVEDIYREACAQINVLKDAGVSVSHLDSHGHYHKYPSFQLALGRICKGTGITKVRRTQNIFLKKQSLGPKLWLRTILNKGIVSRFKSTDFFYMSANSFDVDWADKIYSIMNGLPENATIEIGVHPGVKSKGDEAYRINEYHDIVQFAEKIRNTNHQIINWNNI